MHNDTNIAGYETDESFVIMRGKLAVYSHMCSVKMLVNIISWNKLAAKLTFTCGERTCWLMLL